MTRLEDTGRPVVTGQPDTVHQFNHHPAVTARGEATGRVLFGTESMSAVFTGPILTGFVTDFITTWFRRWRPRGLHA
ncbi:hypothetical protein [Streptomyces sp. NPDC054865]